jgi:hypothetical protein
MQIHGRMYYVSFGWGKWSPATIHKQHACSENAWYSRCNRRAHSLLALEHHGSFYCSIVSAYIQGKYCCCVLVARQ